MKNTALFLALYLQTAIAHAEDALPYNVETLISQRARAIENINRTFVQELEELKEQYTKQGNLEVANAIVSLIKEHGSESNENPKKPNPIVGVWRWPNGNHGVFFPDDVLYVFDKRGGKFNCKWKFDRLEGGAIFIL